MDGIPIDEAAIRTIQTLPKLQFILLSDPPADRKLAQSLADSRPKLSVYLKTRQNYESLKAREP